MNTLNKNTSTNCFFNIKKLLLILFFTQLEFIDAQNKIPNPSFELYSSLPNTFGQIQRASGWINPMGITGGTVDYFNSAGTFNINDKIPHSFGNGLAGGYLDLRDSSINADNYKEYATINLSSPLLAGVTYNISFYTAHLYGTRPASFNSQPMTVDYQELPDAEKGFYGVAFSTAAPTAANTVNNTTPRWTSIRNDFGVGRALIPETNSDVYGPASRNTWVKVNLKYTAVGTENYMTIGQFRPGATALTDLQGVYYVYDDFSLYTSGVLTKNVSPSTIISGETATYTFTINNVSDASDSLTDISFTDSLPSGLRVAANPNVVVTGLTGGTTTATAGGTSIAASGYSIAANTTATISVNVTNVAGQLNASCGSNPMAFTNTAANISNLSSNLENNVGNVCLVVTPCPGFDTNLTNGTQTVCQNGTVTPLQVSANNVTYQWFRNTANSTVGGTAISGAINNSYTPSSTTVGTLYYYVIITSIASTSCTATSNIRGVTVTANPSSVAAYPTSQTVLLNDTPYTLTGTASGASAYQWYSNTTNSNTGGTLITGATTLSYAPPPTNTLGTTYYYMVANNGTCSTASNVVSVSVENCNPVSGSVPVNLNLWFQVPAAPSGSTVQWHNSATPSSSTLISSGIVQATSTIRDYWVYYYDSGNNCYSPGSRIQVVTNTCCNVPTVNLNNYSQNPTPSGSVLQWYTTLNRTPGSLVSNPNTVYDGAYFPYFFNSGAGTYTSAGTPLLMASNSTCASSACYKPAATVGTTLDTKVGISALGRAGATDADNWPMTRKGGWIALESKTKAFVPNRVAFNVSGNPVGIAVADFVEGMMVYDTTNNCLKIYTLKEGDGGSAWHCMDTQACPD